MPLANRLIRPLRRLLRPLVHLLIRSGVTFPVLNNLLRNLYIDVVINDMPPGSRDRTDSRVSLLTGIHRKELRRQRLEAEGAAREPDVVTLNSQLIARWLSDPAFLAPDGTPLVLRRSGPAPSFDALVAAVTRDLRSRAVLTEWLSRGIVGLEGPNHVVLQTSGLLPHHDLHARLLPFARNLHDHIAAAVSNLALPGAAPFLDRGLHYEGLGRGAAAELEGAMRKAAAKLLDDLHRTASRVADADAAGDGSRPTRRVNLGVYVYAEDESPGQKP